MENDSCENMTPLPSDADVYAAGDEQFQIDEDRANRLRWGPRPPRRDILITDEDRRLGLEDIRLTQQRYKELTSR